MAAEEGVGGAGVGSRGRRHCRRHCRREIGVIGGIIAVSFYLGKGKGRG